MSTTIVEVSQDDINSVNNIEGGDYTVTLKQPILINKNDSVILKSCFIDNRVSNSKSIVIKGDENPDGTFQPFQTISVGFGFYKTDVEGTWEDKAPTTTYEQNEQITPTNLGTFTGRRYPAYIPLSGASTNNVDIISIDLWADFAVPHAYSPSSPYVNSVSRKFVIPYKDGTTIKKRTLITTWETSWYKFQKGDGFLTVDPKTKRKILKLTQEVLEQLIEKKYFSCNFTLPLIAEKPSGTQTIQDLVVTPNSAVISNVTDRPHASSDNGTFDIYTQEIDFTIPQGIYDPDKIATILKEKIISFSGNLSSKDFEISENPLLKTVQQIRINENINLQFFDMDSNTQRRFNFDTGAGASGDNTKLNYYIGSSQFGLDYNQDTQKMEILSIHNSLFSSKFDATTGLPQTQSISPEIRIIRNKALVLGGVITQEMVDASVLKATKFVCNSNCGIYLTKLEPQELWHGSESQFKFSDNIFPTYKNRVITVTQADGTVQTSTVIALTELNERQHVTSDESGLDEIITKQLKTKSSGNFDIPQLQSFDIQKPLLPGEGIFSEIVGVNTIEAIDPVGSSLINDGAYYKVSVDMGIKNTVYGNNNINTISSVISKFYSQNSYTSSYTEGSIPYIHQSDEPIYINEIRVRILDPNNLISDSVGSRNAVFLEINSQ